MVRLQRKKNGKISVVKIRFKFDCQLKGFWQKLLKDSQ